MDKKAFVLYLIGMLIIGLAVGLNAPETIEIPGGIIAAVAVLFLGLGVTVDKKSKSKRD